MKFDITQRSQFGHVKSPPAGLFASSHELCPLPMFIFSHLFKIQINSQCFPCVNIVMIRHMCIARV
jgi:hypothetical protein